MNWVKISALVGATGVALGAFGAHGLRARVTEERRLNAWTTGAHYHLLHAAVAYAAAANGRVLPAQLLLGGVVVFSGALYAYAYTGVKSFGAVAPIGGVALIGGWVALALA